MYDDVHYGSENDIREQMDRMENDGAGVVPQNVTNGKVVHRQHLVDVKDDNYNNKLNGELDNPQEGK